MHSLNIVEDGTLKVAWISKDAVTGTLFTFDFTLAEGDSTGDSTTGTGDDAPVRALTVTLVIAGTAIAVLLAGKKKFAKQ